MASKTILHDLDLQSVSELKNARIHNVTSGDLTTLAGSLGAANRGMIVYNTTDNALYTWNGTSFDQYTFEVTGDIRFAGSINPSNSGSIVPAAGQQYVADIAGTLSNQGGAITYTPSANVEVGDVVLFTSATTASIMERNLEQSTETTLGTIRLADQPKVDAGSVPDEAVTPVTLHGYVDPEFAADRARLTANEGDIAANQAAVSAEETRALAAEGALANGITAEETRALAAEAAVQANVDAEETRALAAEAALQANIDAEAATRSADDSTLQANIDAEATTRAADDVALGALINAEASRAGSAETTLQANIDAEEARALSAEAGLQINIDAEESRATAAEGALSGRADVLEARDEVFTFTASVDLVADTALTVSHNLALVNKDAFTINTMHNGEQVSVQVTSVGVNSLTLTSAVGVTGLVVSIIGF